MLCSRGASLDVVWGGRAPLFRADRRTLRPAPVPQAIESHFLPQLAKTQDPDARASYTRIQTFLATRGYEKEPEGRALPQYDASSYERA